MTGRERGHDADDLDRPAHPGPVTAFEHAMVAMAITDATGRVLASNDALVALLGRSATALDGLSLFTVTHPDDLPRAEAACRDLTRPEVMTSALEVRLLRPDGDVVHVKISTARVLDSARTTSHLVMHLQDVSDHVSTTDALRRLAFRDPLTGLANRALLEDRLEHAVQRHRRDKSPLSVVFVDLDDFKSVNDTRGHVVGDEVLRLVAAELTRSVRADTTVARVGGDEFVVVCEDATPGEAERVAERMRLAVESSADLARLGVRLTASVGVATVDDSVGDVDDAWRRLIAGADAQMYRSKRSRHRPGGDRA